MDQFPLGRTFWGYEFFGGNRDAFVKDGFEVNFRVIGDQTDGEFDITVDHAIAACHQVLQLQEKTVHRSYILRRSFDPDQVFAGGNADVEFFLDQVQVDVVSAENFRNDAIGFKG